jgi:DNA-binding transcriptional LysR family regulator
VVHGGPALVEALLEHRIDAGVTRWLAPVVGIEAVPWVQVGLAVMLPGGHRLADQRSVSLDDLADEALILPPEGRPHRVRVETAFAARGIRPRVEAEVDGWDLQRLFVSAGLGLAIVNDYCPAPEGGTARRLEGFDPLSWCFVHRSAGPAHPAAAEVRRWFEDG